MKFLSGGRPGAYRPYRKYRKCGMTGGDVPRGPPRAKIKKMIRALAGGPFGLRSANVWGGIEVRGGPGTVRHMRHIIMQIPDSDSLLDCHLRLID